MYLARRNIKGRVHYFIRESFRDGNCFRCRDLFSLGTNPCNYIIYPGGNAYYIDEVVEDSLCSLGVEAGTDDLEDLFRPFFKARIRRILDSFGHKSKAKGKKTGVEADEPAKIRAQVSDFDKRRAHFLRCGRIDQGYIGRMPVGLYKWVIAKSRDEIEQRFMELERCLQPRELKTYVYASFDLQRFFSESWAKKMPQGLDQEKVDDHFMEEICRLNGHTSFWMGAESRDSLHEYLVRYVIMFFDNTYEPDTFWRDYIKDFMDARRKWRFPQPKSSVTIKEASTIFGIKEETLKTMTKRGIVRLYRRMAQKLHPDKGGTHEEFVQLTEAYHELLRRKGAAPRWRTRQ